MPTDIATTRRIEPAPNDTPRIRTSPAEIGTLPLVDWKHGIASW